jgi:hypothetical protein
MASALEQLGINQEVLDNIEPESVYEGKTVPSGLYVAAVDKVYIRKTGTGANMLEVDFKMSDDSDFHYSTCVLSGDEKGNKTTYTTKQGKERALPGVESMTKFLNAIGSIKAPAVKGDVEHRGETIQALCFTGLQGKKLQLGINQEENFYQGEVLVKNDVKYWLTEDGKNSAGEDLVEKVTESLAKHPLRKLKSGVGGAGQTASAGTPAAANAQAPSDSGW